jgi:zinc finger FYVE domain-containing protein 26
MQVLKKDYVAAGLCCIQLFLNSSHQDQALGHLERAKVWKPFFWKSKHGNGCSDSKPKLKILRFFYCSEQQ